jgi:phosphoserine aminotransferase
LPNRRETTILPRPVLEQIQAELLDYRQIGMSVMEMSHRSQTVDEMVGGK